MKNIISLCDLSFYGDKSSSRFHDSEFIEWDRKTSDSKVCFFTDLCLEFSKLKVYKDKIKIALLIEPIVINKNLYEYTIKNQGNFDYVLTHHKKILPELKNGHYYFFGGSWIKDEDWHNYDKNLQVSMIASNKNFTYGHNVRHHISANAQNLNTKIDLLGSGYKPLKDKIDGCKRYRYQIVVENCKEPGYHTEKIIDCFATHTIPIYFGSETIFEDFDPRGIIMFGSLEELSSILDNISEDDYLARKPYIEDNFIKAKNFKCAEDWIYSNFLMPKNLL